MKQPTPGPGGARAVALLLPLGLVLVGVAWRLWFLFQIVYSLFSLDDKLGGGVAYGAHIGGFIAGLALVKVFAVGVEHVSPPLRRWPRRDERY